MILAKLFNHGQLKNIKVENGKLVFEGTYGKEEFTDSGLPAGGSAGQVVTKTSEGAGWSSPNYIPDGGTAGQVLTKYGDTDYQAYWADSYQVPTNGSIGQYLKRYGEGDGDYAWADIPAGGKPEVTITVSLGSDSFMPAGKKTLISKTPKLYTSGNIRDYLGASEIATSYINNSLSCRVIAISANEFFVFDGCVHFVSNVSTGDTAAAFIFHGTSDGGRTQGTGAVTDRKSLSLAISGLVTIPAEGPIVLNDDAATSSTIYETTIEYVAST